MQTDHPRTIAADAAALIIDANGAYRLVLPEGVGPDDADMVPVHVMYLTAVMLRIHDDEFVKAQLVYLQDLQQASEEERYVFPPTPGSVWQHRKGGIYVVLGVIDDEVGYVSREAPDMRWWRSVEEFLDGRFTPMPDEETPQFDDLWFKQG